MALDMTEGQPEGHSLRTSWIGLQIGRRIGLGVNEMRDLHYVLLLKDLGCSSNAAEISRVFKSCDLSFKRNHKRAGAGAVDMARFAVSNSAPQCSIVQRLRTATGFLLSSASLTRSLFESRCLRGAQIARRLRFPEDVAQGIAGLDERWDGRGYPYGLKGDAIPVASRIALLAQIVEVFHREGGPLSALHEACARSGTWFDPRLVSAFCTEAARPGFWEDLVRPDLASRLVEIEPAGQMAPVDEDYLDDIASAFGDVIDAKSPFTAGHSVRVADYALAMADGLGLDPSRRSLLRRAALLHDIGKLGVSSLVLEKPGRLEAAEWEHMKSHALFTGRILKRIRAFDELGLVAEAHHERLDGAGYPHGLSGEEILMETRIISVADMFDAMTADRPYRAAMPVGQAIDLIRAGVGAAVDERCFDALDRMVAEGRRISHGWTGAFGSLCGGDARGALVQAMKPSAAVA
jgi:putative nucleotidyltransferase with HDIG domain